MLSSRLIAAQHIAELAERIKREEIRFDDPIAFFDWLQQARLITPYQAKILSAHEAGPFVFGEYVISQRLENGPLLGQFLGFHRPTGHPVLLEFFNPVLLPNGRNSWNQLETLGQKVAGIKSPCLIATYETVSLPDYAFVVSEKPPIVTLSEKIPRKARLPWQSALGILHQIATAVNELHLLGVVHGDLNPRSIYLEGKLKPRLKIPFSYDLVFQEVDPATGESRYDYQAPEVLIGQQPTTSSDIYSLGCLLVRLISGRTITGGETVPEKIEALKKLAAPDLTKYDLPAGLVSLLRSTLDQDPFKRPASVKEFLQEITRHTGKEISEQSEPEPTSDSLNRYLKHRASAAAFFASPVTIDPSSVAVDSKADPKHANRTTATIANVVEFQKKIHAERRKSQFVRGLILLAGTLAMFGIVFFSISRSKVARPELVEAKSGDDTAAKHGTNGPEEKLEDLNSPAPPNAVVHQFVRDDDGLMLWESPTSGQRFSFELLPLNPRLIFIVRPADLANHPQGSLALQSLAPELQTALEDWRKVTGLEMTDIRQLVLALYPQDDARYTPLSIVYLSNDVPRARLKEIWNVAETAEPSDIYSNATTSFLTKTSPRAADKIEAFVMGPKNLVEQAADYKAINSLDGSLGELATRVDASRHFTAMILPSALFNQQGQELVGKLWEPIIRQARILTDDHIRGVIFSIHFDNEQSYWELTADHSADVTDQVLVETLKKSFADTQSMIVDAAAFLPADNYWNRVRLRVDNMFDGFIRNSRFGSESGFVIVNSWVPATAIHNLLKAADLAVRMNGTSPIAAAPKPVAPQSLQQLLGIKRDLKVTTNPDLNVLLQTVVTEVKDSHPGMPFDFRIEMIGNDLVTEGITQNQRPGDFELKDATLASILTEIVVRANPDKSATGPADPKCKLVWVITDDPQKPGAKIIQITTRAAAEAKSLELPQQFRVEGQ